MSWITVKKLGTENLVKPGREYGANFCNHYYIERGNKSCVYDTENQASSADLYRAFYSTGNNSQ